MAARPYPALREQLLPQLFRLRAMQLQLVRVRNMVRLLSKQAVAMPIGQV